MKQKINEINEKISGKKEDKEKELKEDLNELKEISDDTKVLNIINLKIEEFSPIISQTGKNYL